MFNNPFASFHDTVAEAKEEREQLDRLLTVSTPRERLLVALVGLLLLVLAAWLVFGSVPRNLAADGVLAESGESLPGGGRAVQALVWLESDAAADIKAGMPAAIELGMADGEGGTLDGKVAAISAVPLPGALAALGSAAPLSVHRVDIALDDGLDPASLTGRECRVVFELDLQSPVALFLMGPS